eukprot:4790408-Karenia_brevis.AAC.1
MLWQLSQRWNPHGFVTACEWFLDAADDELDGGYSIPLRSEAMARGCYAEALKFLMSPLVQEEINGILQHCSGTSLDVERMHQHVKRPERGKVISVASASRNNILRQYILDRGKVIKGHLKARQKVKQMKFMPWTALLAQRRPDLVKRPRGKLHWEQDVSARSMASITVDVDEAAKDDYIRENKQRLQEEAAQIRAKANSIKCIAGSEEFP